MIAEYAAGLGDPWNLTPAQWDATVTRIYERIAMEHGDKDAQMQVRLQRLKRSKRAKSNG